MKEPVLPEETLSSIAGGRFKVLQKAKGYRFSIDALLLSHFVTLRPGDSVLELGTGSGIISLILAGRGDVSAITGIDIQEGMVEMARRSVAINGLGEKIQVRQGDVREVTKLFLPHSYDVVVSNPPYRKVSSGRINPVKEKSLARHEIMGTVGDFLQASGFVLKPGGRIYFIYPATRMVELLWSMRNAGIEPKRLRTVHSHKGGPAKFVLVEGIRGGGEELDVLFPLFIYNEKGGYTGEMKGIFRELSSPGSCER